MVSSYLGLEHRRGRLSIATDEPVAHGAEPQLDYLHATSSDCEQPLPDDQYDQPIEHLLRIAEAVAAAGVSPALPQPSAADTIALEIRCDRSQEPM